MTKQPTNEDQWSGRAASVDSHAGASSSHGPEYAYSTTQVETQAAIVPGSPTPRYPEILTSAGIEGQVYVEFVIDTTGRVDMGTFRVLRSDHDAFSEAVKNALPRMHFYPAEAGGHKVKELVQLPFAFALTR
jgi:protein TonB